MTDDLRSGFLADLYDVAQRDHFVVTRTDVVFLKIARVRAKLLVCLNVNTIVSVKQLEVVDKGRAEIDAQRGKDLRDIDV